MWKKLLNWKTALGMAGLASLAFVLWEFWPQVEPDIDTQSPSLFKTPQASVQNVLTVWGWGQPVDSASWERISKTFEKETGQVVSWTIFPTRQEYETQRAKLWQSHQSIDVFLTNSDEIESLNADGHLRSFTLSQDEVIHWTPASVLPFRRADQLLAFPSDFSVWMLFYNRSIFDQVGIAYPDTHWNWDIFVAISRALFHPSDNPQTPPRYSLEYPLTFPLWQTLSCQAGPGLYQGSEWKLDPKAADSPPMTALRYLLDWVQTYDIAQPTSAEPSLFEQGQSAMRIAGAEMLTRLQTHPELHWGVTFFPQKENPSSFLWVNAWAVSPQSSHADLALKLANELSRQPSRSDWLPAYQPDVTAAHRSPERLFYEAAETASFAPPWRDYPSTLRALDREISALAREEKTDSAEFAGRINSLISKLHHQP